MGAVDLSHGRKDFFARWRMRRRDTGNLMLKPEQQAMFVEELPEIFLPVAGGWGRNGATHVVLEKASEDVSGRAAIRTGLQNWRVEAKCKRRKKAKKWPRTKAKKPKKESD